MSQTEDTPPSPRHYRPGTGSDRYSRFCDDWLGVARTGVLDTILEAFEEHQKVIAMAANGVGKSFGATCASISGTYTNRDTTCNITSGSYGQLDDTIWKPMKSLHRGSQLPGRTLDNTRELRTGLDDEWYIKCLSPRHPGDLEGRHNDRMLYVIEEADKPGITAEHIDSALSTLTDEDDRILVICNPPEDEHDVTYELFNSDQWHSLQFSSWDSHDCQVDLGEIDGEKVGGLADLSKIKSDWRDFHGEEWPGIEQAKSWSDPDSPEFRTDLDSRWYRRRAGIVPPDSAEAWRPIEISTVKQSWGRSPSDLATPQTVGIDVARSGDKTVATGKYSDTLRTEYAKKGSNHAIQKDELSSKLTELGSPNVAVDAVGEGSGLADELSTQFAGVERYSNGSKPMDEAEYYDCWAEALALFGQFLESGGVITDDQLYKEAMCAARVVEFSTRALTSRGGDVIEATSKSEIKDALGHSPDYLDSALMAVWRSHKTSGIKRRTARSTMHKGR